MYHGILEALDGQYITSRSNTSKIETTFEEEPKEELSISFWYQNPPGPSPGVYLTMYKLTKKDDVYSFRDFDGRPFRLTIQGEFHEHNV